MKTANSELRDQAMRVMAKRNDFASDLLHLERVVDHIDANRVVTQHDRVRAWEIILKSSGRLYK